MSGTRGVRNKSLFSELTHPRQRALLSAFGECVNVRLACETAGVGRSSHYRWLKQDPAYHEAFELAKECAADLMESEAYRRAVTGVDEPVGWYKGEAGGMIRRYSDILLMFLLKGVRPEKYKDRVELGSSLANLDLDRLPDDLLARIAGGEHPQAVLAGVDVSRLLGPGDSEGKDG